MIQSNHIIMEVTHLSKVIIKLDHILKDLDITMNKLAVESKIRPGSIVDLTKGDTKAIKLETLARILDTLNLFASRNGKSPLNISDILEYIPDTDYFEKNGIYAIEADLSNFE